MNSPFDRRGESDEDDALVTSVKKPDKPVENNKKKCKYFTSVLVEGMNSFGWVQSYKPNISFSAIFSWGNSSDKKSKEVSVLIDLKCV